MFFRKRELPKWIDPLRGKYNFDRMDKNILIDFMIDKMPHHIWNTMAVFEGSTATLQNTFDVLSTGELIELGKNEEGIPFAFQIESYKKGTEFLCDKLRAGEFEISFPMAAAINGLVGAEIEFYRKGESGKLRTRKVSVGMEYEPPDPEELPGLVNPIFKELNAIKGPFEKAVMTFAAMAKLQLFLNANKRTALLMMNGVLIDNEIHPVFFPRKHKSLFIKNLSSCYNDCSVEPLSQMIAGMIERLGNRTQIEQNMREESEPPTFQP